MSQFSDNNLDPGTPSSINTNYALSQQILPQFQYTFELLDKFFKAFFQQFPPALLYSGNLGMNFTLEYTRELSLKMKNYLVETTGPDYTNNNLSKFQNALETNFFNWLYKISTSALNDNISFPIGLFSYSHWCKGSLLIETYSDSFTITCTNGVEQEKVKNQICFLRKNNMMPLLLPKVLVIKLEEFNANESSWARTIDLTDTFKSPEFSEDHYKVIKAQVEAEFFANTVQTQVKEHLSNSFQYLQHTYQNEAQSSKELETIRVVFNDSYNRVSLIEYAKQYLDRCDHFSKPTELSNSSKDKDPRFQYHLYGFIIKSLTEGTPNYFSILKDSSDLWFCAELQLSGLLWEELLAKIFNFGQNSSIPTLFQPVFAFYTDENSMNEINATKWNTYSLVSRITEEQGDDYMSNYSSPAQYYSNLTESQIRIVEDNSDDVCLRCQEPATDEYSLSLVQCEKCGMKFHETCLGSQLNRKNSSPEHDTISKLCSNCIEVESEVKRMKI